ncbi:heat shock protein beta-7-like [Anas acuta]|uniref:heat shock protein beta-7-like n=1 Tax=Anas acuta TaxID=28680 RepID=UPI0035C8D735
MGMRRRAHGRPPPLGGTWALGTGAWWHCHGDMASLSSAATYRAERISTYSQGHPEPRFEGERYRYDAFGYPGSPGAMYPCSLGPWVRAQGDTYQVVADVSQFEPPDIVVTTSNGHIAIRAEKVAEDGTVCDTFTHQCRLPEDTDPLSVSCALTEAGTLLITARRRAGTRPGEPPQPLYRSEATLGAGPVRGQ